MEGDLGDNSEKFIGLSFDEARIRVLNAFKLACSRNTVQEDGGATSNGYLERLLCCFNTSSPYAVLSPSSKPSNGVCSPRVTVLVYLNGFAIILFIIAFAVSNHLAFRAGLIIPALILICLLAVNIWALGTYRENSMTELSRTLSNIVINYESYVNMQSGQGLSLMENQCHIPSGHSQLSIVNAFRGGKWMKIPLLLLAEGDIIALMGGDIAPCKVYELLPMKRNNQSTANVQYNESLQQQWILGELLAAGTKILINKVNKATKSTRPNLGETRRTRSKTVDQNSQHQHKTQSKSEKPPVPPDSQEYAERQRYLGPESTEILRLAGDIRCFLLAETPIAEFVQTIYERHDPNKNVNTFIQQLMTRISLRVMISMKWLPILLCIAFIIRLAAFSESRHQFSLTVFSATGSMIVLMVPVTIPLILITAEAMGTAEILSALEVALHRGEESKKSPPSQNGRSHLARTSSATALPSSPRQTVSSPMALPSEDNEFIDEDIDARAEDIADETDDKVEYRRFFTYILEVLRTRLFGLKVESTNLNPAFRKTSKGPPLLPIPLASLNMVDQLGAITMVCFVDDDVICENYSVTEEIFLLTEKHDDLELDNDSEHPVESKGVKGPRIKGTVLDLHANPEATGSRFENPLWWKFLPSLKPLGIDALLTYKHTIDKNVAPSLMPPTQSYLSSRSKNKSQRESKRTIIERSLVRHIQHTLPLEALRELSEEIGFTDEDLRIFTKALDVNVIASGLENAHLLEDNHQWGQEESRRRGSLLPQLRGGVYQDSRGERPSFVIRLIKSLLTRFCFILIYCYE
ncbi:hypothetical protein EON65_18100 [archaeon]|nr:MAG: hypothetical protein EON65_18100 [archaeon]